MFFGCAVWMPRYRLKQWALAGSAKDGGVGVPTTRGGARDTSDCSHIARGSLGLLCAQRAGPRGHCHGTRT